MANLAKVPGVAAQRVGSAPQPRHVVLIRVTHWIFTFSFLALLASGTAIVLAHPRLYWGETGAYGSPAMFELPLPLNMDHSGWGRRVHFLAAWICVLAGVIYVLFGVVSGHFAKNMLRGKIEFRWPSHADSQYNGLQRLAYLTVVFALVPVTIISGLAMSPAIDAVVPWIVGMFGGQQSARTVHFFAVMLLVAFLIIHVTMVSLTGFWKRMRAMTVPSGIRPLYTPTRRTVLTSAAAASIVGVGVIVAKRDDLIPPDYSGKYGAGEVLTYAAQRLLLERQPLAREFSKSQISVNFPAINTVFPDDYDYRRQMSGHFRDWNLPVDGLVEHPYAFSLAELKSFPSRTQITQHICEQGWSAIVEWTGVSLSYVLRAAGIRREAKYVVFYAVDGWWDSLDMADAWHPQTLLAYGMNGRSLPIPHGAPVRLRVERQLGYKSLKYLSQITVTDSVKNIGKGKGALGAEQGYSWYAGI